MRGHTSAELTNERSDGYYQPSQTSGDICLGVIVNEPGDTKDDS